MGAVREGKPATESRAMGTVIGHKHRRRRGTDVLVHPVVKFQTGSGETIEFESGLGSNIPPKVGEAVEVFYDPSNPESRARITVGSALRLTKWHFIIVAAIFAVPAAFFLLFFLFMVAVYLL